MWERKCFGSCGVCPDCGYGIKAYFEKIKIEEEEKIRKQKQKKRMNNEVRINQTILRSYLRVEVRV